MRSWVREPLVYFVLAGALIFAVDHALHKDEAIIRITPSVRDELARSLAGKLGRAPDAAEIAAEVEGWKQEEALYREGVKMGLADDDPVVRSRVATKFMEIAQERDVFPPPTDAELRDFLDRNKARFASSASFDFEQVFIARTQAAEDASAPRDASERADEVLAKLRAGAPPEGLGDWFPRGTRFTAESPSDIAQLLGDEAAREIPRYSVGQWNLVRGPRGFHAIRVTRAVSGEPDFDRLRASIAIALDAERRSRAAAAYAKSIESHFRFVESP
ncbi:MAG TPA: peptidylprolyl isomerase [Polyangiaceae bacterium]|nr:peptidylprolyl isomerase [Polyangiaceae bacterium]